MHTHALPTHISTQCASPPCSVVLPRVQELEADQAACAALAQAGVAPAQWAAGLSLLTDDARAPEWRLEEQAPVREVPAAR